MNNEIRANEARAFIGKNVNLKLLQRKPLHLKSKLKSFVSFSFRSLDHSQMDQGIQDLLTLKGYLEYRQYKIIIFVEVI